MPNSASDNVYATSGTLGPGVRGGGGPRRIERILLIAIVIEAIALLYLTAIDPEVKEQTAIPMKRGIK